MTTLDDLEQRAADRKEIRLAGFLADIRLAADAAAMGPGACKAISQYTGWSSQTMNRLAMLEDLPRDLIDPELPLGIYWTALMHAEDTSDDAAWWIREAQLGGWSQADLKHAMGVTKPREQKPAACRISGRIISAPPGGMLLVEPDAGSESLEPGPCVVEVTSDGD